MIFRYINLQISLIRFWIIVLLKNKKRVSMDLVNHPIYKYNIRYIVIENFMTSKFNYMSLHNMYNMSYIPISYIYSIPPSFTIAAAIWYKCTVCIIFSFFLTGWIELVYKFILIVSTNIKYFWGAFGKGQGECRSSIKVHLTLINPVITRDFCQDVL